MASAPDRAAPPVDVQGHTPAPSDPSPPDYAAPAARAAGCAEAMAVELAKMADDAPPADGEEVADVEQRIRTVHELMALPSGEVELLLFRLGAESFAFDLAAAEEAVELESVHAVPDMPDAMLGVFDLRGRLVPVYSPAVSLRSEGSGAAGVLLLMRAGERRVGLVVDDVQDVVVLDRTMLRPPPSVEGDGLVLGLAFFGDELVTILDAHALVATCALPATAEVA
jgi:purine-binding chemotaxis protein CheW